MAFEAPNVFSNVKGVSKYQTSYSGKEQGNNFLGEEEYNAIYNVDYSSFDYNKYIKDLEKKDTPEAKEQLEQIKNTVELLKSMGLTDTDINRVLSGEISLEELLVEIQTDDNNERLTKLMQANVFNEKKDIDYNEESDKIRNSEEYQQAKSSTLMYYIMSYMDEHNCSLEYVMLHQQDVIVYIEASSKNEYNESLIDFVFNGTVDKDHWIEEFANENPELWNQFEGLLILETTDITSEITETEHKWDNNKYDDPLYSTRQNFYNMCKSSANIERLKDLEETAQKYNDTAEYMVETQEILSDFSSYDELTGEVVKIRSSEEYQYALACTKLYYLIEYLGTRESLEDCMRDQEDIIDYMKGQLGEPLVDAMFKNTADKTKWIEEFANENPELWKQFEELLTEYGRYGHQNVIETHHRLDFQTYNSSQDAYQNYIKQKEFWKNLNPYVSEFSSLERKAQQLESIIKTIDDEVNYYLTFITPYIYQPDFKENCKPSQSMILWAYNPKQYTHSLSDDELVIVLGAKAMGTYREANFPIPINDPEKQKYLDWIHLLTDDEKRVFFYLYNTQGTEGVFKYLDQLAPILDDRCVAEKREKDAKIATASPWNMFTSWIAAPFVRIPEGLNAMFYSIGQLIKNKPIYQTYTYSSSDIKVAAIGEVILKDHGEFWYSAYNNVTSIVNMIPYLAANAAVTIATGGTGIAFTALQITLSVACVGAPTYTTTLNDALDRGLSDSDAVILAASSAIVEMATEYISLGHLFKLEKILGKFSSKIVKLSLKCEKIFGPKVGAAITRGIEFLLYSTTQGLCESEEELASSICNFLLDEAIAGNLSNYSLSIKHYMNQGYDEIEAIKLANRDSRKELWTSFIGGLNSGIFFGGTSYGVSKIIKHQYSKGAATQIVNEYLDASPSSPVTYLDDSLQTINDSQINVLSASESIIDTDYSDRVPTADLDASPKYYSKYHYNNEAYLKGFNFDIEEVNPITTPIDVEEKNIELTKFKQLMETATAIDPGIKTLLEKAFVEALNQNNVNALKVLKAFNVVIGQNPNVIMELINKNGLSNWHSSKNRIQLQEVYEKVGDTSVILHELGHCLHTYLIQDALPTDSKSWKNILTRAQRHISQTEFIIGVMAKVNRLSIEENTIFEETYGQSLNSYIIDRTNFYYDLLKSTSKSELNKVLTDLGFDENTIEGIMNDSIDASDLAVIDANKKKELVSDAIFEKMHGQSFDSYIIDRTNFYKDLLEGTSKKELTQALTDLGIDKDIIKKIMNDRIEPSELAKMDVDKTKDMIKDAIDRKRYPGAIALSDIISAVYKGKKNKKLNICGHSAKYYATNPGYEFLEMFANFTELKVLGATKQIQAIEVIFGSEFFQALNTTWENAMNRVNDSGFKARNPHNQQKSSSPAQGISISQVNVSQNDNIKQSYDTFQGRTREANMLLTELHQLLQSDTKSDPQLTSMLYSAFDQTIKSGNEEAMKVLRTFIAIKRQNPDLILKFDLENCAFQKEQKIILLTPTIYNIGDKMTLIHELGHSLHHLSFYRIPSNWVNILDNACNTARNGQALNLMLDKLKRIQRMCANMAEQEFIREYGMSSKQYIQNLESFVQKALTQNTYQELQHSLKQLGFLDTDIQKIFESDNIALEVAKKDVQMKLSTFRNKFSNTMFKDYMTLSDIIDAVYGGSMVDNHMVPLGHGMEYFSHEYKWLTCGEIIANFTSFKVYNKTDMLQSIQEIFGTEFYQAIDYLWNNIMRF